MNGSALHAPNTRRLDTKAILPHPESGGGLYQDEPSTSTPHRQHHHYVHRERSGTPHGSLSRSHSRSGEFGRVGSDPSSNNDNTADASRHHHGNHESDDRLADRQHPHGNRLADSADRHHGNHESDGRQAGGYYHHRSLDERLGIIPGEQQPLRGGDVSGEGAYSDHCYDVEPSGARDHREHGGHYHGNRTGEESAGPPRSHPSDARFSHGKRHSDGEMGEEGEGERGGGKGPTEEEIERQSELFGDCRRGDTLRGVWVLSLIHI